MDAVGAVGRAGRHLVQEDHLALPLLDPHGVAGQAVELAGQVGQLVVVGGEEPAAAVDLVQVLDAGPGDRQARRRWPCRGPISSRITSERGVAWFRIAAASTISTMKVERPRARVVGGADPAEQPVDRADHRARRRHEAADLRQHGDQRVLAQEGGLAPPCWGR